jgi:hypothetical protein
MDNTNAGTRSARKKHIRLQFIPMFTDMSIDAQMHAMANSLKVRVNDYILLAVGDYMVNEMKQPWQFTSRNDLRLLLEQVCKRRNSSIPTMLEACVKTYNQKIFNELGKNR